jgi:hypothetical protein
MVAFEYRPWIGLRPARPPCILQRRAFFIAGFWQGWPVVRQWAPQRGSRASAARALCMGLAGPLNGGPSWSKRSRNTKGFKSSPKSDGLIYRVTGPYVRPRVRRAIACKRGNIDLAGLAAIGLPVNNSGISGSRTGRSSRVGARPLQGSGPPQQIVDQRLGRRLELCQACVDIAALVVRPQSGDRDMDR